MLTPMRGFGHAGGSKTTGILSHLKVNLHHPYHTKHAIKDLLLAVFMHCV